MVRCNVTLHRVSWLGVLYGKSEYGLTTVLFYVFILLILYGCILTKSRDNSENLDFVQFLIVSAIYKYL